jgi:hypothetical protein
VRAFRALWGGCLLQEGRSWRGTMAAVLEATLQSRLVKFRSGGSLVVDGCGLAVGEPCDRSGRDEEVGSDLVASRGD